jgi:NADH-quinone oxidoreductase subunit C
MSGEKDLEQVKREAAEKAKAAALAKKQAKQSGEAAPKQEAEAPKEDLDAAKKAAAAAAKAAALAKKAAQDTPAGEAPASNDADLAKQKAAAAAKAKAAALAKAKAKGGEAQAEPAGDDAKAKAAAAAKAKAAAAAKAKAAAQAKTGSAESSGDDEKAKAVAAAKAKAAAAAKAKAAAAANGDQAEAPAAEVEEVSANQQYLDKYRKVIEENLGADVLEDSYINKLSNDVPTLVAKRDTYFKLAQFLKYNELLSFEYLSELHGTDFGTHMEIYAHFYSYKNRQSVALKVKIDRDEPTIESVQPIWPGANWPECEAYDLLGIKFTGHPDLHRIMLGEDWVGHPLRKDYEPYDVEV